MCRGHTRALVALGAVLALVTWVPASTLAAAGAPGSGSHGHPSAGPGGASAHPPPRRRTARPPRATVPHGGRRLGGTYGQPFVGWPAGADVVESSYPYLPGDDPDRDRWGGYAYPPGPCDPRAPWYDAAWCEDALPPDDAGPRPTP